jgi:hypothetical protein
MTIVGVKSFIRTQSNCLLIDTQLSCPSMGQEKTIIILCQAHPQVLLTVVRIIVSQLFG